MPRTTLTHTQAHAQSKHSPNTHSYLTLSLRYALYFSRCCALSGSCCAAYPLAGSRAGDEYDNDDVGSSWLCGSLVLPGCLRQTCLLAKMVCLASLVVAFVTVVGNQKNLAALSTRLSTGQTAGRQLRRPCPCQLTQMVIDSLFPLNTARLLLHPAESQEINYYICSICIISVVYQYNIISEILYL